MCVDAINVSLILGVCIKVSVCSHYRREKSRDSLSEEKALQLQRINSLKLSYKF
jgi:hypothetical protein